MKLLPRFHNIFKISQLWNNVWRTSAPTINNLGVSFEVEKLPRIRYDSQPLSQEKFLTLSRLSDTQHLRETLSHILVPRVVGSKGHHKVREFIVKNLQSLNWNVDVHKFHDTAPILGKLHFHNIIATLNPQAERYLVLACHYDSKYMPDINFLGAIDSALPCALLINLAHVLQKELNAFRSTKLSLMLLFFDGEEAFEIWGPKDSIYGARHLAQKWETEKFLQKIDILILLDLIGAPDPKFYSFFRNTENWYARFLDIEERLSDVGQLEHYASSGIARPHYPNRYFQPEALRSSLIEDDHIPFLNRDVPILHVIPVPFPEVWHTENDNEEALDFATSENIARIVRLFTMEYLLGYFKSNNSDNNNIETKVSSKTHEGTQN